MCVCVGQKQRERCVSLAAGGSSGETKKRADVRGRRDHHHASQNFGAPKMDRALLGQNAWRHQHETPHVRLIGQPITMQGGSTSRLTSSMNPIVNSDDALDQPLSHGIDRRVPGLRKALKADMMKDIITSFSTYLAKRNDL
jgi:hypothetical protein